MLRNFELVSEEMNFSYWREPKYTAKEMRDIKKFFDIGGDLAFDSPMEIVELCLDELNYECELRLFYGGTRKIVGVMTGIKLAGDAYYKIQVHMMDEFYDKWKERLKSLCKVDEDDD